MSIYFTTTNGHNGWWLWMSQNRSNLWQLHDLTTNNNNNNNTAFAQMTQHKGVKLSHGQPWVIRCYQKLTK